MHLCGNCQKRKRTPEGIRCVAGGSCAQLFESGQPVAHCESFRRLGDGKHLLVDRGGRVGPQRV